MRSIILFMLTFGCIGSIRAADMEDCKPEQVHISYGDSTSEMVIMWSTKSQCDTQVHYSTDMWKLDQTMPGESRVFSALSNKDGIQIIHRVHLRNLLPEKTYFYKPISNNVPAGPFFFKVPGVNTSDDLEFLVINNLHTSSPAISKLGAEEKKPTAILHLGNIAMNMSTDGGKNADKYFRELETSIASVPYMTSPGESEIEDGHYSHYLHRLSMPQCEWPMTTDKMWYSLDIGLVHLISFSTDVFFTSGGSYASLQHNWLIKDITAANKNREKVPWVVAFGHEPLYCSYKQPGLRCHEKTSVIKKELEDIFYHYGVDIVLQSYGKAYERTLPMFKGVAVNDNYTNPLGPVYIVNGGATAWKEEFNFTDPNPAWIANRLANFTSPSYGRLRIINSTLAEYDQVSFEDNSILDTFEICQENHGEFDVKKLSPNITKEINKATVDLGGKPGDFNIHETETGNGIKKHIEEMFDKTHKTQTVSIIGGIVGGIIFLVVVVVVVRKLRKKTRATRRWEAMDINYGKKFYSKAPDREDEHDFEIDMSDETGPTRKLLNADD